METSYLTQSNSNYCSSCRTIKQINEFENNNKTCIECLTRVNKGKKRKLQERNMDDIREMQENAIEPEELEDVVYKKLMDNIEDESSRMELN
ncbi:14359_t:CDS:1, partial [Racocetra fulgida]